MSIKESLIMVVYAIVTVGTILLVNKAFLYFGADDTTDIFIGSVIVGVAIVVGIDKWLFGK